MLEEVKLETKRISDYKIIVGEAVIEEILNLSLDLRGSRVVHINSTAYGGGVAELLTSVVPLMNDLKINTSWHIIRGSDKFFTTSKLVHNGLQGMDVPWTKDMIDVYLRYNRLNASRFDIGADFVIIHDPQPAAMLYYMEKEWIKKDKKRKGKWIWRCHIDLSEPDREVWSFLSPYIVQYDMRIFTMGQYVKDELNFYPLAIIPPSIDPLSFKNIVMQKSFINRIISRFNVDPERPLLVQISRFDPWKDPLGVIDVYRIVKKKIKNIQLVLIGSMADDDPEGWVYWRRTQDYAAGDPDIHLLSNLHGVGGVEVNCFQRAAEIIVQKSLREGFGLTVSEGLWKSKPVIGGAVGGIGLQIQDGINGYLVKSVEDCAERVIELLEDPKKASRMGRAGRGHVKKYFLTTRYILDYLKLFKKLLG